MKRRISHHFLSNRSMDFDIASLNVSSSTVAQSPTPYSRWRAQFLFCNSTRLLSLFSSVRRKSSFTYADSFTASFTGAFARAFALETLKSVEANRNTIRLRALEALLSVDAGAATAPRDRASLEPRARGALARALEIVARIDDRARVTADDVRRSRQTTARVERRFMSRRLLRDQLARALGTMDASSDASTSRATTTANGKAAKGVKKTTKTKEKRHLSRQAARERMRKMRRAGDDGKEPATAATREAARRRNAAYYAATAGAAAVEEPSEAALDDEDDGVEW